MKCHKPNTDQEAWFAVLANDQPCAEYSLPSSSSNSDMNILKCFIPVAEGDQLRIRGSFAGSVLYGCFDLLADGSFIDHKRIEGSKGEVRLYANRKFDFNKVKDAPKETGPTTLSRPSQVVEGNLHVKDLPDEFECGSTGGTELGVGSLAIICSANQKSNCNHSKIYASYTCGDWREDGRSKAEHGGIAPNYELEVVVTDDDVSKNRQTKHKRHFAQTRFGRKPWAKFIFYYRSKDSIEQAGLESRPAISQALEPADAATFAKATQEPPKRKRGGKDEHEDDTVTLASRSSAQNRVPVTDTSPRKRKLFRQSLSLLGGRRTLPWIQLPPNNFESPVQDYCKESNGEFDAENINVKSLAEFAETLEQPADRQENSDKDEDHTLHVANDDEVARAIVDAENFLNGHFDGTTTPVPTAQVMALNSTVRKLGGS